MQDPGPGQPLPSPEPEAPAPEVGAPEQFDREAWFDERLAGLSHADLAKRSPAYNQRFMQSLQHSQREIEQRLRETQQREANYRRLVTEYDSMTPEQVGAWVRSDPGATGVIQQITEWREQASRAGQQVDERAIKMQAADEILSNLRARLQARPEWAPVIERWDEHAAAVSEEADAAVAFLDRLIAARHDQWAKTETAQHKAEREALEANLRAKLAQGMGIEEPEAPAGAVAAGSGHPIPSTLDEARALHARGEITNQEMRRYLGALS